LLVIISRPDALLESVRAFTGFRFRRLFHIVREGNDASEEQANQNALSKGSELKAGHGTSHCEEMESMNVIFDLCLLTMGVGVVLRENSAAELVSPASHSGGQGSQELPVGRFQLRNRAIACSHRRMLVLASLNRRGDE
jgi:hypothetical protein